VMWLLLVNLVCLVVARAHQHDHDHDPMEKLKHAFKSSKDDLKQNIRSMVVDENQILMEEIIASAQGRKRMFDSDEPGGQKDGEEDDSDARKMRLLMAK